jgi:hypothetical protein
MVSEGRQGKPPQQQRRIRVSWQTPKPRRMG